MFLEAIQLYTQSCLVGTSHLSDLTPYFFLFVDAVSGKPVPEINPCTDPSKCQTLGDPIAAHGETKGE